MDNYPITEAPQIDYYSVSMDVSGLYFKIECDFSIGKISVSVKQTLELGNGIQEVVFGNRCQDIYFYIIQKYINQLSHYHCAYLGKELKKAEMAMALGSGYYQE